MLSSICWCVFVLWIGAIAVVTCRLLLCVCDCVCLVCVGSVALVGIRGELSVFCG